MKRSLQRNLVGAFLLALLGTWQLALETDLDARAGGGRSGGSRGSRSYQAPSRPMQPSPSQQRREAQPPPQQPSAPLSPQTGGFMRGLAGGIMGGFLGSLLFSGIAQAGWGGFGGSGIGLFEILLIAGVGYFLIRKFRTPSMATNYGSMQYQSNADYGSQAPARPEPLRADIDYGSMRMMDGTFDPARFLSTAQDIFFKIQGAWNHEDVPALRTMCAPELMQTWEDELTNLRTHNRKNRMDNIALRESEITEAWTESGTDYITVRLHANLLDFTIDANTGAVVEGSNSTPVEFEEFWTFSRPVGPNGWKLSAVQQANA